MNLQERVTETQVREKIADARRRADEGMRECREAKSAGDYGAAVRKVKKAADDHASWRVVLAGLGRPVL